MSVPYVPFAPDNFKTCVSVSNETTVDVTVPLVAAAPVTVSPSENVPVTPVHKI